jgi:hypothetical protein
MPMTDDRTTAGEGDVNGTCGRPCRRERIEPRRQRGFDDLLQLVRLLSEQWPLVRGCGRDVLHQRRDGAALPAEELVAECFQILFGCGLSERLIELGAKAGDRRHRLLRLTNQYCD